MFATGETPYQVGDRLRPEDLHGWSYKGLSGKPGIDAHATRRYTRGDWVLELRAQLDQSRQARVMSIRTQAEDLLWWEQERQRRSGGSSYSGGKGGRRS